MAFGGPTSYSSFAQPFQPLGQPLAIPVSHESALTSNNTWHETPPMQITCGNLVQFVCGSPQDNDNFSYSYQAPPNTRHAHEKYQLNRSSSRCDLSNHSTLKHSRSLRVQPTSFPPYPVSPGLYSSTVSSAPETYYYQPAEFSQPRHYADEPTLGLSADDLSVHSSHCRSLVNAVEESQQCSFIFSKWRDSLYGYVRIPLFRIICVNYTN